MEFSDSVITGTLSGVISGLLVALTLGVIEQTASPKLELRRIDKNTALLKNNGFRPVAFGGTYAFEKGPHLLYPKDGFRGQISEMRCNARSEIVVGCAIHLGESLSITYKPIWPSFFQKDSHHQNIQNQAQQADVISVYNRNFYPWWTKKGWCSRMAKSTPTEGLQPTRLWGWRVMSLPLKPM